MVMQKVDANTEGSVEQLVSSNDQELERLSNYLPEEVLIEILSRLPVESVGRMKCLNPSWYNLVNRLIKDTTFQAKHLQNSKPLACIFFSGWHFCHRACKATLRECPRNCPKLQFSRLSMLENGGCPNVRINYVLKDFDPPVLPRELYADAQNVVERYHCNGVFCLVDDLLSAPRSYISLYNPAINEFKLLPPSGIDVFHRSGMGFGYDPRSNDHKIVRFGPGKGSPTAELYSLATNSWRNLNAVNINIGPVWEIHSNLFSTVLLQYFLSQKFEFTYIQTYFPNKPISEYYIVPHNHASCKQIPYWVTRRNRDKINMILSFDVSDEVFNVIEVPESIEKPGIGRVKIASYNESLALFFAPWGNNKSFDMWVLKDFTSSVQGSFSWNKVATVRHLVAIERPLGFMKIDELFMQGKQGELFSYNIRTKWLRKSHYYLE